MTARLEIDRAGPLVSVQDEGRHGMLVHGISASGPLDKGGFLAAAALGGLQTVSGIEFGAPGLDFTYRGDSTIMGFAGGRFRIARNGEPLHWPGTVELVDGDRVGVTTGEWGNWGYLRFASEIDVPEILGSRATNLTVALGGYEGRALKKGDILSLGENLARDRSSGGQVRSAACELEQPIRFVWGLHAEAFPSAVREAFCTASFRVSSQMNRMGTRLADVSRVFAGQRILSLVSDSVVPGDIQILGDGTPIVLARDHQPTGGYPRIGTVIEADQDRFSQIRPGRMVHFTPISVASAHKIMSIKA